MFIIFILFQLKTFSHMNQDQQQRRQLPRRTSRGVRHQQTQEQKKQDDRLYDNLFGILNDDNDDEQSFAEMIGLRPLECFTINFANFNYARGYHYFFNLQQFPRVQGSRSYALDDKYKFNYTFSHDQQQVNGIKLGKLFNRTHIGLPRVQNTKSSSKSSDKNVCHYNLFSVQDKKFFNSRLILKYKYVLLHLQSLCKSGKLATYTDMRKDAIMYEVCEPQVSIQRKRQVLENRIKVLEQRYKAMQPFWEWEDKVNYHFSLDQQFHNQAMAKGQKLSEKYLLNYVADRVNERRTYILGERDDVMFGNQVIRKAIETWCIFQQETYNALSNVMQNELLALPKTVQMFLQKQEFIIFPLFTFNFGSRQIARFIDPLIMQKLRKQDEGSIYVYKSFVKRLLKRELQCQQSTLTDSILSQQYKIQMRQKMLLIEDFYKKEITTHRKIVYLDELVQMQKLQNSPINQKIALLDSADKIEISLKQLMLMFFYRNISIALQQFMQYLKHDPQMIKLMTHQNYQKFHYGIARIIHQPQYCILINDLIRFSTILNSKNNYAYIDQTFHFKFNQKLGAAYAWIQPQTDQWETQKESSQVGDVVEHSNQLEEQAKPKKKVKEND